MQGREFLRKRKINFLADMTEYPIARAYMDTRVQKIYGGTNEIMKEIIGRTL